MQPLLAQRFWKFTSSFDLVILVLILHEMSASLRTAVLQESVRVAKVGGHILLMDFHPGPYPFPRGWIWKTLLTGMEMSYGCTHFANCRDFLKRGGLPGICKGNSLAIRRQFAFESGVAGIFLVAR